MIRDLLTLLLAPALGTSVVLMAVLRCLGRERFAPLAAALAVGASVAVGNYYHPDFDWQIDSERPLTFSDLSKIVGRSLEFTTAAVDKPDNLPRLPLARFWLPWLAALAMAIELLVGLPFVPTSLGLITRTLVAMLAGRLLTAHGLRIEMPWLPWLLGTAIALEWSVLAALAREWNDGTTAVALLPCLAAAGLLLVLETTTARHMDMALLLLAGLVGPALVSWVFPGNTAPAVAAVAVFLPGILMVSYFDYPEEPLPPLSNFLLVALAPLALTPMLLPAVVWHRRWRRWLPGIVLPLVPVAFAVWSVLQTKSLNFNELDPPGSSELVRFQSSRDG